MCGVRNDGGVGEEQQFVVIGQLGKGNVGHDPALAQNASLLVEDGAQQHVGVDEAFHDDIGLATPYGLHGLAGCLCGIVRLEYQGCDDAVALSVGNGLVRRLVVGTNSSHSFFQMVCFQVSD